MEDPGSLVDIDTLVEVCNRPAFDAIIRRASQACLEQGHNRLHEEYAIEIYQEMLAENVSFVLKRGEAPSTVGDALADGDAIQYIFSAVANQIRTNGVENRSISRSRGYDISQHDNAQHKSPFRRAATSAQMQNHSMESCNVWNAEALSMEKRPAQEEKVTLMSAKTSAIEFVETKTGVENALASKELASCISESEKGTTPFENAVAANKRLRAKAEHWKPTQEEKLEKRMKQTEKSPKFTHSTARNQDERFDMEEKLVSRLCIVRVKKYK